MMEISVLAQSLESSILYSDGFQRDYAFWGVGSAAAEELRRKVDLCEGKKKVFQ